MDRRRNTVCFCYLYRFLWVGNVQRYLLRKTIEEARGGDVAIDDDVDELVLPTKRCEFSSLLNTPCTVWMRWGTDEKWKHKLQTNKHHHPSIHPQSTGHHHVLGTMSYATTRRRRPIIRKLESICQWQQQQQFVQCTRRIH